jgi:hypothetical protein
MSETNVMANDSSGRPRADASDKELALWMLERMRDSEGFLGVIRDARSAGGTDILDTPDYVARHKARLAPLYQGADEETVEVSATVATLLEKLGARDLASCNEELLEKALAAYIAKHPKGGEGLPSDWPSTFDAARAEIEGRTTGAFKPGFTAELAASARAEMVRQAANDRSHGTARNGREG